MRNKKVIIIAVISACMTGVAAAEVLVHFGFENHTAGSLLTNGVGSARLMSENGDTFPYNPSTVNPSVSASQLTEPGGVDLVANGAADVRADTLLGTKADGNFVEFNPKYVKNRSSALHADPAEGADGKAGTEMK
jgi:hypothetical protein